MSRRLEFIAVFKDGTTKRIECQSPKEDLTQDEWANWCDTWKRSTPHPLRPSERPVTVIIVHTGSEPYVTEGETA